MNNIRRKHLTDQMNAELRDWYDQLSSEQQSVVAATLLSKRDAAVTLGLAEPAMEYSLALAMFCNLRDRTEEVEEANAP